MVLVLAATAHWYALFVFVYRMCVFPLLFLGGTPSTSAHLVCSICVMLWVGWGWYLCIVLCLLAAEWSSKPHIESGITDLRTDPLCPLSSPPSKIAP